MKKLCILALVALSTLFASTSFSQSIILINGQPTEVILKGDDIESIVNTQISDYLKIYDKAPKSDFKFAKLRTLEHKIISKDEEEESIEKDEIPKFLADSNTIAELNIK